MYKTHTKACGAKRPRRYLRFQLVSLPCYTHIRKHTCAHMHKYLRFIHIYTCINHATTHIHIHTHTHMRAGQVRFRQLPWHSLGGDARWSSTLQNHRLVLLSSSFQRCSVPDAVDDSWLIGLGGSGWLALSSGNVTYMRNVWEYAKSTSPVVAKHSKNKVPTLALLRPFSTRCLNARLMATWPPKLGKLFGSALGVQTALRNEGT